MRFAPLQALSLARATRPGYLPLLLVVACSSAQPSSYPSTNPCGPGGEPWKNPYPVVAQTTDPDGTVIDWIPINSQSTNGEPLATPPPPSTNAPESTVTTSPFMYQHQGPPGTVPIPHPRVLTCECHPGYTARPGSPCVKVSDNCSSQGFAASSKDYTVCCPGLQLVRDSRRVNGQCVDVGIDYGICARCGDGVCAKGETDCNCPLDCPKT
jgi:hypothetical protein